MYYLAVLCPPPIDEKVQAHKVWMRTHFGCMVALKSPAHITIIPPFWMEHSLEESLIQTLCRFQPTLSPVKVQLQGFSHFSNRVLFIGVTENPQFVLFQKAVENHFLAAFPGTIKPDDRPFHPHVTIANRDLKPGDFTKAWEHFSRLPFDEQFEAQTVSLLRLSGGKWRVSHPQPIGPLESLGA